MTRTARSLVPGVLAVALVLAVAACEQEPASGPTPDDGEQAADEPVEEVVEEPTPEEVPVLEMLLTPSQVAIAIAQDEGLFEGVEVDYTQVGYGEQASLFLAQDLPVGHGHAPHDVAEWITQGEDLRFVSTASSLNFWNGLVVRAEDADTFQDVPDVVGHTLGIPGFGTGTWLAFEAIASAVHDLEASEDFEIVTADPGALLGLLASGEVDAALSFAGQAATALALDEFELVTSFTREWQEADGHPLVISGLVARGDWLDENSEVLERLIRGIDDAVQWMKDNPDELTQGGAYADWVEGEGWLRDDATNAMILDLLQNDDWYFTSELYTQEWIESAYRFTESALAPLVDEVPDKDEIFYQPAGSS